MNLNYYLNRIKQNIIRFLFNYQTRTVFQLPPVGQCSPQSQVVLLSMLQESDLQMYLLAAKSLMRYLTINKVVIVCDPSLSLKSREIIKQHITRVDFLEAINYRHEQIPVGGTWERLHAISHLTKDYYTIQMDADILTLKKPEEVLLHVKNNHPFILGSDAPLPNYTRQKIEKSEIVVAMANNWIKKWVENGEEIKIQPRAEAVMGIAAPHGFPKYTRGCSGFAGFSKGCTDPETLYKLSNIFHEKLGEKWLEWGSEQFASTLLLSNTDFVSVLPIDRYNSSDRYCEKSILVHFIGYVRFSNFLYIRLAKTCIKKIKGSD